MIRVLQIGFLCVPIVSTLTLLSCGENKKGQETTDLSNQILLDFLKDIGDLDQSERDIVAY